MTTDESIMMEMLDRATNPKNVIVDELGVQMFCIVVRSNSQLVQKAQEMIISKVRSNHIVEATRAIALLEECMTQCGDLFQDEAAKFRFLNELIRLVSKKYSGAETAYEVKQRIMECLLLWTTEFPQRQKIRDAYDMLRKEGDIEHGQSEAAVGKRESVLNTIDEAMFAKLIKSKNPENFKRANLLLQYRMGQEARRNELISQHRRVLQEVQDTMQLLNQMLDTYNPNDHDVNDTIHDLYKSCKKHKPIFQHLPELLGQSDSQLIEDTLETNEALLSTITRYKQLVSSSTNTSVPVATATIIASNITAAAKPETVTNSSNNAALLNELLGDLLLEDGGAVATTTNSSDSLKPTVLQDLSDIFSSALAESEGKPQFQISGSGAVLEPQVLSPRKGSNSSGGSDDNLANGYNDADVKASGSLRKMPEIDKLSDQLFQQILPAQDRMSSFKRDSEKITLNDLARERMHDKPVEQSTTVPLDDVPLLGAVPTPAVALAQYEEKPKDESTSEQKPSAPTTTVKPTMHLSEISIDLDNIQPTGEERVMLDDDEMHLSLNFTEDRPSRHVSVIVISATNKSRQPVKDFQFDASVKKPCKVRLLPPTDNTMAAHKPFRPATPINQVMLLLNSTGKPVDITCIVGYKLGDDPDPIKESIVAQAIAYVE